MSSEDYQRREFTHVCSRSDIEACVFNVNLTDSFDDRWSQCRWLNDRAAPTDTNPKNLELAPPQSVTATKLDQLVYSPNYYIQIFQTQPFARSEDWTLNLHARSYQVQRAYQLRYGSIINICPTSPQETPPPLYFLPPGWVIDLPDLTSTIIAIESPPPNPHLLQNSCTV